MLMYSTYKSIKSSHSVYIELALYVSTVTVFILFHNSFLETYRSMYRSTNSHFFLDTSISTMLCCLVVDHRMKSLHLHCQLHATGLVSLLAVERTFVQCRPCIVHGWIEKTEATMTSYKQKISEKLHSRSQTHY